MRRWLTACATVGLAVLVLTLLSADRPATVHGAPSARPTPRLDRGEGPSARPTPQQPSEGQPAARPTPQIDASEDPPADLEDFRQDFVAYLSELQEVVAAWEQDPYARGIIEQSGIDLAAAVAAAQEVLPELTADELAILEATLSLTPNWRQQPALLSSLFDSAAAASPAAQGPGTYTLWCEATVPTDIAHPITIVLKGVALVAKIAWAIAPDCVAAFGFTVPSGVKTALSVVWLVAELASEIAQASEAVSVDCEAIAGRDLERTTYPTNGSGNYIRSSSQATVNASIQTAQEVADLADIIVLTVQRIKDKTEDLRQDLDAVQVIVTAINSTAATINGKADILITNLDILNNTEKIIDAKADLIISNLSTFEELQVQMKIEANLSRGADAPIALFQLPQAHGGYLEMVQEIVTETIDKKDALGKDVARAQDHLSAANDAFGANEYKSAYRLFRLAYQEATN